MTFMERFIASALQNTYFTTYCILSIQHTPCSRCVLCSFTKKYAIDCVSYNLIEHVCNLFCHYTRAHMCTRISTHFTYTRILHPNEHTYTNTRTHTHANSRVHTQSLNFEGSDFALVDTLFSLAEAYLFMQLVEFKVTMHVLCKSKYKLIKLT
jgi:hypothetical protein